MTGLIDRFGRRHDYLRISVTERCNLRCQYCMPPDGIVLKSSEETLTIDEILHLADIFVGLGITKIRITGGEPLVRKDIVEVSRRLAQIPGLQTVALSTNGVYLQQYARDLRDAGVRQINISLDTLKPERFARITLRQNYDAVLHGIEEALGTGFESVKINTVVMRGFNDDELHDFVGFARALSVSVRFIEYMPFLGNGWSEVKFIPYREMKEIIETKYPLTPVRDVQRGTAKEFRLDGGSSTVVGFISTMSEEFCESCSRLRLTADGKLRYCLFGREEMDLKHFLRKGAGRGFIMDAIQTAVMRKWEKRPSVDELLATENCAMVALGG